jgi:hypothetical protein
MHVFKNQKNRHGTKNEQKLKETKKNDPNIIHTLTMMSLLFFFAFPY